MSAHERPPKIEPGVKTDLAGQQDYARYLGLGQLLASQRPVSSCTLK